jgi:hypothetical protein
MNQQKNGALYALPGNSIIKIHKRFESGSPKDSSALLQVTAVRAFAWAESKGSGTA